MSEGNGVTANGTADGLNHSNLGVTSSELRRTSLSGQNIDERDPEQLNILYARCRDAVLNGTHPVTLEEAIQLAAIQCHVQYAYFLDAKHKSGIKIKDFLPKDYVKSKGCEKKIFAELDKLHANRGLKEIEAKAKYIQLCKSLKTYGIKTYLVKEKMHGKSKLVPVLLGITSRSVIRLDEKTKEILQIWPMTRVKRWAPTTSSFTLDFGDYSDGTYVVQTNEGEQISKLIGDYIDMYSKKKTKDHVGIDDEDDGLMAEENVEPSHAQYFQINQTVVGHGDVNSADRAQMDSTLSDSQRELIALIDHGMATIRDAQHQMESATPLPQLGGDAKWKQDISDLSRQKISAEVSAMNAATAQLITLSAGDQEPDPQAVSAAIVPITSNVGAFSHNILTLAAMHEDKETGNFLLDAAQRLAGAISDLLNAAKPNARDKHKVIAAAETVGKTSKEIMNSVIETDKDLDKQYQETLNTQAGAVAGATSGLVEKAKNVASSTDNQELQNKVIKPAADCALAASQLVACTQVVAPTIGSLACQEQLIEATKQVSQSVDAILDAARLACHDDKLLPDLRGAAALVTQALNDLLKNIKKGPGLPSADEEAVDTILSGTDKTISCMGNAQEMVKHAQLLDKATSLLISAIKGDAEGQSDSDMQKRLLAAAKALADATAKMMEAAKGCASNPNDSHQQEKLRQAAEDVRSATNMAAINALKKKLIQQLENAARQAASASTQLVNAANSANNTNKNTTSKQQLAEQIKEMNEELPKLVQAFRASMLNPDSATAQLNLTNQTKHFIQPANALISAANAANPNISDHAEASNLSHSVKVMSSALEELRSATSKYEEVCVSLDIDSALNQVFTLDKELAEVQHSPGTGKFPKTSKSFQDIQLEINKMAVDLNKTTSEISTSGGTPKELATSAKKYSSTYEGFVHTGLTIAGMTKDQETQSQIVGGLRNISMASSKLLMLAQSLSTDPNAPNSKNLLQDAARAVTDSINKLLNTFTVSSPGQKECDDALRQIQMMQNLLESGKEPVTKMSYFECLDAVMERSKNLSALMTSITDHGKKGEIDQFCQSVKNFAGSICGLTEASSQAAHLVGISDKASTGQPASSQQTSNANEPIISAGKAMIGEASYMVQAAKQLVVNTKDLSTHQKCSHYSKTVSDAIKKLVASIKVCVPGQKECDESIDTINKCVSSLDQASLSAINGNLAPRKEKNIQGYQEQIIGNAKEIVLMVDKVKVAAKSEPEHLGHRVTVMTSKFVPVTDGAIGAASLSSTSKQQTHTLDHTKTVMESALRFLYACKEGGGNSKATHAHGNIDTAAENTREVLQDLLRAMEEAASQAGMVTSLIEEITKSMNKTGQKISISESESYVSFQTKMVSVARKITMATQDMVGKSTSNPSALSSLVKQLTKDYDLLATSSAGAAATSGSPDVSNRIRTTVKELGRSCIELVQDTGNLQANPGDTNAQRDLANHARGVTEKVSLVLTSLQAGSLGTQACIDAANTISGIIADLDTTVMFASAGALNREGNESFTDHREDILKTATALEEDKKTLLAGATSNQQQLAGAAQQAVKTITQLADVVKSGAASLGSDQPDAQVLLINAVKDVASSLSDLINSTKNASGKSEKDPALQHLKESAKVMETNVSSLLNTVITVEDKASRGTHALEGTIKAIAQEIKTYDSTPGTDKKASAEDLIRLTKPITTATAKAVAAGNSCRQEDITVAANMGRKAVFDLLGVCKAAAATAETTETQERTVEAGRAAAVAYNELLQQVHTIVLKPSTEAKQSLITISRKVANSVTEIVHAAEVIKGSDWVNPEDPTVIAENELLTAANAIEAAAKKLSMLKPRQKAKEADMSLNFEEQILEATKAIAAATAALVKSASEAQKELVAQGKIRTRKEIAAAYHKSDFQDDDGQWSQGLISAAQWVARATQSLCEAANAMVQGNATEERLVASAKEVAASTAALLMACQVKADPGSKAMERLQLAGNRVKKATDSLVKAAQQTKTATVETEEVNLGGTRVGRMTQELQAMEEMLKKEKELEAARSKLAGIRKARYN